MLAQPSYNVSSTWPQNSRSLWEESRGTLGKFLLKKVGDFFSLPFCSFMAQQFAQSITSLFPAALSLPYSPPPHLNLCFSFLLHSHSPSFPTASSHPLHPYLCLSVCLFLSVIVSLVQRRTELKSRAKLARATTLLLPSGWDSFNAPLESSTVCVHSLLRTSFLHKTTAKKTGEKSEKHIKGQQKPQNGEQPLLIT